MSKFAQSQIAFIAAVFAVFFLFKDSPYLIAASLILFIGWIVLMAFFSMSMKSGFFLQAKTKAKKGHAVLSFDDGPDPGTTMQVLDILDRHKAKAVFFLVGRKAMKHPGIVKEMIRRGHKIGGHSYSHSVAFGFLDKKKTEKEIMKGIEVLEKISGAQIRLFRPPFGVTNPAIADVVKKHNLEVVGWNVRSYDTRSKNPEKLLKRILSHSGDQPLILLHDRMKITVEILPALLENLQKRNLIIYPEFE